MKTLLTRITTIAALALATLTVHAQSASTVEYGRSILTFDPSFTAGVASLGAQLGGAGFSNYDTSGVILLPAVGGSVDLQTARGEVNLLGGLTVHTSGATLRLQSFVIDTTGKPLMTALLIVNNQLYGRIPLFDLAPPSSATLPLSTTAGVLQVNGYQVTFDPNGAAAINSVFGTSAIQGGMLVGTMNLYAVLSPNSAS